jgi:hypothetical protein
MRSAITTMLIAAGLATAAVAQTPAAAPAAPASATSPVDIGPAPATTADPSPAAVPPEPVLPTVGDGAEVARIVQNVCMPLVKGGNIDQLTAAAGKKRGLVNYVTLLGGIKGYTLTLDSQGSNKDVCSITLNYAINGEKPIIEALNIWAYLHDPYMPVQRNDYIPATDYKRITNSWEHFNEHESQGLVFLQLKKPDGTPVSDKFDLATVLYSERKF